jgi:long-chain acyl-CoA synthetase
VRVYGASFPVPAELIGPGGPFELEGRAYRGRTYRMFKHGPRTLGELLTRTVAFNRRHPDARMTEQDGARTTYGAFEARAAALAETLSRELGVKAGDHVAIAMANRVEWMIAFFAIAAVGAAPVLVNSRGVGEEMHHAIRLADCVAVVADRERHDLLAGHAPVGLPSIVLGAAQAAGGGTVFDFDITATPTTGLALSFAPRDPEDIALIMFSSGTTGRPKAIAHAQGSVAHTLTLGCLVNEAYDALYEAEFGEALPRNKRNSTSTLVMSSPLFHVAGILPFMRAIMNGQATVLVTKWNAETVYDVLERETVSRLGLVPTMVIDLMKSPRAESGLLSDIRYLANGTAPLAPEVAAKMRELLPKCLMFNTFGQSETMERVATFGGREFEANLAASGRVMPTAELRIVGDDGVDVEPGQPGEILARGPTVMLGYYNDAKATADALKDGWLHTGDIGRFDEKGLLHILDRKKNMVISGGENIYCAEVERVLADHPDAAEALAYGEPDPRLGERLVAVVVLKPGAKGDEAAMKAYCKQRLAIYKVPRAVSFTDEPLPRNATGKVAKGVFLERLKTPA